MRIDLLRQVLDELNVKELYFGNYVITQDKVYKMNTVKENKDISKGEARFIQYFKIILMVSFLSFIVYKFHNNTILLQCL